MNFKIIISIIAAVAVAGSIGIFYLTMPSSSPPDTPFTVPPTVFEEPKLLSLEGTQELKKFSSYDEIQSYLQTVEKENSQFAYPRHGGIDFFADSRGIWTSSEEASSPPSAIPNEPRPEAPPVYTNGDTTPKYSITNVQVKNVDEPDFIKNDDKYVYIVSGDKLTIIEAYPAESATIVLKIGLDIPQGQSLQNIFLNEDRLVIFYQDYKETDYIPEYSYMPTKIYSNLTHIIIMDVSDKEKPQILKDYSVNGYYNNARMIDDIVYLITTHDANYHQLIVPQVREASSIVATPDVFYFDNPEPYYNFNTVSAIDISDNTINSETFMMGGSGTIYVSEGNLYITYQKNMPYRHYQTQEKERFFDIIVPLLPQETQEKIRTISQDQKLSEHQKWNQVSELLQETYNKMSSSERTQLFEKIQNAIHEYDLKLQQETFRTVVHKIALNQGTLKYIAKSEVPGRLLNQFSMDESGNRFRIATTSEYYGYKTVLYNNVFVLDENLNLVGKLEKIAPDESIYSTRFMGDRLYMVTFQRIDPFFVIDLSTDTPKILGELKIPGFSNYLHPYDQNHIIGIGKETKENQWGGVQTEGVKIALFDVTNVANPTVIDVETIGKQGTESDVLSDHKALLFDKDKRILSIPIWNYGNSHISPDGRYVEPNMWRGFYVYDVDVSGFSLKGTVMHSNGTGYDYGYGSRSFYIDDVLYTVSSNLIKMNDMGDLHEINHLKLRDEVKIIPYID